MLVVTVCYDLLLSVVFVVVRCGLRLFVLVCCYSMLRDDVYRVAVVCVSLMCFRRLVVACCCVLLFTVCCPCLHCLFLFVVASCVVPSCCFLLLGVACRCVC